MKHRAVSGTVSRKVSPARERGRTHLAVATLLLPSLVLLLVFIYLPALQNVWYSVFEWSAISTTSKYVGLANFAELFSNRLFWFSIVNNVWYAVISVAVQVFIALALAAILEAGLFSRTVSSIFRVIVFIPSILPVTAVGALWKMLLAPDLGLINQGMTAIGLDDYTHAWLGEESTAAFAIMGVSQWQWTGYIMVLFIVAIRAIPRDYYEAMSIDGGGRIRQFWHITVPGVRETTLVMIMITIFGAFQVFDIVWVMTRGGPNNASQVLGTLMYRAAFRDDTVGIASAIAVVIFVITFALGVVQIKLQREEE